MKIDPAFWSSGALISLDNKRLLLGYGQVSQRSNEFELENGQPAFYFPHFSLTKHPAWFHYEHYQEVSVEQFFDSFIDTEDTLLEWNLGHQEAFQSCFQLIKEGIATGLLKKAVPYTFAYSPTSMKRDRLHKCLRSALEYLQRFPGTLYGRWEGAQGFLGVTPELLFSYLQGTTNVNLVALAGTLKRGEEIINAKLAEEHQIVVEGIVESLCSFGQFNVGKTALLQLALLSHLVTPISLEMGHSPKFSELVERLHPTPALGTYPREAFGPFLGDYQTRIDRREFGAPVGVLYQGEARCHVAIRQIQWDPEGIRIGAGVGVVAESSLHEEWEEIQLKIAAVRGLFAL